MPENGSPDVTVPAEPGDPGRLPSEINVTLAHSARVYDYLLGGKDNFAADRALGDVASVVRELMELGFPNGPVASHPAAYRTPVTSYR